MHRRHRGRRGFTLVEIVVAAAIVLALAGILIPVVRGELESTRRGTALGTCQRIATGIEQFMRDTGQPPSGNLGANSFDCLQSNASMPSGSAWRTTRREQLSAFLTTNGYGGADWSGPYLGEAGADPWRQAYVVNVRGFSSSSEHVWVMSAGPNGILETDPTSTTPSGDDLGIVFQ